MHMEIATPILFFNSTIYHTKHDMNEKKMYKVKDVENNVSDKYNIANENKKMRNNFELIHEHRR